jgi:putative nucleotidyltransferase with HDIG domain
LSRPEPLDEDTLSGLLRGITLPPQPDTLVAIHKEQSSSEPQMQRIAEIIVRDVSVAAGVLKTVNSPLFGVRRTIGSVQDAALLLGVNNVVNIVTGLALKETLGKAAPAQVDAFFDRANVVALASAAVARELSLMPPDVAYTLGLFHDCGKPLLWQRFPQYGDVLAAAAAAPQRLLTELEDEQLGTNHAVVGYYLARSWRLPEEAATAIRDHHQVNEALSDGNWSEAATMVALLAVAEHIADRFLGQQERLDWEAVAAPVFAHLDLTLDDFDHLCEEACEGLAD